MGESVEKPLKYYENNMVGTFTLVRAMLAHGCGTIVFSSSATVYGDAAVPITESSPVGHGISNPYGWTKSMMEQVLRDVQRANPELRVVLLRYFNPVGAHPRCAGRAPGPLLCLSGQRSVTRGHRRSGRIGEDPKGMPNNLMPYVQQVAVGRRPKLMVFGDDYDTRDGTGVRDYIHVVDLALGHLAALRWVEERGTGLCEAFNLGARAAGAGAGAGAGGRGHARPPAAHPSPPGTGNGYSVLEMVAAMKKASGRDIPYEVTARRGGDLATVYADPSKAREVLGWEAKRGLEEMCADAWRWQRDNPYGYRSEEAAANE